MEIAGRQPIKRTWEANASRVETVQPATIADGDAVGDPISATGGGFVAVSDAELLEAMRVLTMMVWVLTARPGAAAYATLLRVLESGLLNR